MGIAIFILGGFVGAFIAVIFMCFFMTSSRCDDEELQWRIYRILTDALDKKELTVPELKDAIEKAIQYVKEVLQ